jgi:hypothetical protein
VPNEVRQSSLVAVPSGSAVEIKVVDQKGEPVNGATVTATGTTTNLTQMTVKQGCVVFGAIADKTVEVGAAKSGWVGTQGVTPATKSVTPSESLSATEFTIAAPGAVQAKFSSNGTSGVSGETIFAAQSKLGAKGFVAGTAGTPTTAVTMSGLYPFVSPNTYTVYAGDCEENNPEVVSGKVVKDQPGVQIEPGVTSNVEVEEPPVNITVMSGTKAGTSTAGTAVTSTSAKLINKACASKTTQTGSAIPYEHAVKVVAGKLERPYAPYATALELCVVFKEGTTYYKNKTTFANTKKEGLAETAFYVKGTGVTSSTSVLSC